MPPHPLPNQAPDTRGELINTNQAPKYILQMVKLEQSWRGTQAKTLSEASQDWLRHHPAGRIGQLRASLCGTYLDVISHRNCVRRT
jgi:hypothetical protein